MKRAGREYRGEGIYAVVLAAGLGQRFGRPKALAVWNGRTFLDRVLDAANGASLETIVVANSQTLHAAQRVSRHVALNDEVRLGMLGSIQAGIAFAQRANAGGVVVLPVDHPLVQTDDCVVMATALATRGAHALVVATSESHRGHPVGIGRAWFERVLALDAKQGTSLRDLLRAERASVTAAAVSPRAFLGVNTPEDLERLSALSD